ncbi:response regulator [Phosphitispora fastidiosa]|uniref:response regulator n=1 Tax=Phosphitispora fastidiosa TaxID=2837202 RepID=UPI001E4B7A85|nr:response regulator [Phosphitispora fastidiosa]MBU7007182.1 two-component system chemotaxis response regulator CheY [Phosphitispora fastidiosa]
MKTLIVEDDFISRRLLQAILSPYGTCDTAVNGKEAVEAFTRSWEGNCPYDLICLDILMPEMDGHEVLSEIRRTENQRNLNSAEAVKVIMTTMLKDPNNIMKAFKNNCEEYLSKPIEKQKLLQKVRKMGLIE